nr:hypothetical protein [Tanacetum cinerariifolium]
MTSFGYRLNPRYAIKECSACETLYTRYCSCSKENVEDKILVLKPPKNYARCARCGHPVDGPYCQGCTFLRKKLKEDLVTHFQGFQNTFKLSDDSTNIVNIPLEPFIVKQDHGSFVDKIIYGLNKAPDSPHLHTFSPNQFHCFHCKDVLGDGFDQTQPPQSPVIHPPPQETSIKILHDQEKVFKIKDAFGNEQYKPEDVQELFHKLLNDVQNIHEELAEYINTPDEVIKSSVEDLVPIPSESEGIPDTMCDVHLVNNPTPLEAKDHNIKYVEASPHDSELVSLEVEKIVIPEDEEIEDDNLHEKLLKVNLLIAKIEALKDNPTPSFEFLTKPSSTSPKPFLEGTDTFDNSLPEFENFCFDLEEISSGSTTTHSDISLPNYKAFYFDDDHIKEISSGSTTTHSDIFLSDYEAFSFYDDHIEEISSGRFKNRQSLAYLTYPVIPPHLYSFGNEDTIFNPGITINHFYSFKPGLSHRCGTFKKFNTHRSHLNESPIEMLFSTLFPMDQ